MQLPKEWKWVKLGEECEVVTGTTPPKSDSSNYGADIPFFKPPHLWDGLISDTEERLSFKGADRARVVPPNTVLVTCIGNLGRTGFVKKKAAFNQQINAILENEKIDGKYIFYQAQSPLFKKQLEKLATGTTVSIVNKGNFETIDIPLPPKPIQQAIVSKIEELFSELDKGIENLHTAQQQIKTYRQSVLKWAFEGKKTEGWKHDLLNNLCDQSRGLSYGVIKLGEYDKDGIPCLRTSDVRLLRIETDSVKKISKSISNNYKRTILKGGEVLVNIRGTLGGVAVVPKQLDGWNISREIAIVPILNNFNPDFIAYQIASIKSQNWLKVVTKGIAYSGINLNDLRNLPVVFPSFEEQNKIVQAIESRLSVAEKMEESINQSLQQAEALRQSILKKAFEGKLL